MVARSTSAVNSSASGPKGGEEPFVLDLPKAHYAPLKVGILTRKTKLDETLETIGLQPDNYIWYTEIIKKSSKSGKTKKYRLILATDSFYMLSLEGQWAGTKVK